MVISSTLLALNLQKNFDEVKNVDVYLICVVQENIKINTIKEINENLVERNVGEILPICNDEIETAFTVILKDFDKGLKLIKRLLWEYGYSLSTKIILVSPQIKLLKDYGESE